MKAWKRGWFPHVVILMVAALVGLGVGNYAGVWPFTATTTAPPTAEEGKVEAKQAPVVYEATPENYTATVNALSLLQGRVETLEGKLTSHSEAFQRLGARISELEKPPAPRPAVQKVAKGGKKSPGKKKGGKKK